MSVDTLNAARILTYLDVAASTIFVWDYMLTLELEVDFVWKSKWNLIKVIFLVQRYLPFVDTVWLNFYYEMAKDLSPATCRAYSLACGVLLGIGYATSQIILAFRTWALWNRDSRLSIILPILYILCWGSMISLIATSLADFEFESNSLPGNHACIPMTVSDHLVISWVPILFWDTFMFGLMLISGIRAYKTGSKSDFMKAVYRDGLLYYMYLFILLVANISFSRLRPVPYQKVLSSIVRCLHSVLASRVLLQIRSFTAQSDCSTREDLVGLRFMSGNVESRKL